MFAREKASVFSCWRGLVSATSSLRGIGHRRIAQHRRGPRKTPRGRWCCSGADLQRVARQEVVRAIRPDKKEVAEERPQWLRALGTKPIEHCIRIVRYASQVPKKVVALPTARLREHLHRIGNLMPCGLFHQYSDLQDGVAVPPQQVRNHLLSFTEDLIA